MKISYKNTALNLLDKWDEEINFPEPHRYMTEEEKTRFGKSLLRSWPLTKDMYGNKIVYISNTFIEAYYNNRHKLKDVFDKEEMEEYGTFITQRGSFTHTNFYYLKTFWRDGQWMADYSLIQFSKHSQNEFKSLDIYISGVTNDEKMVNEKTFIWKGHYDKGYDHLHYFAFLVTFLCFIKYVQVETKEIKVGKKEKHVGVKYLNETRSDITILDSTWFTTLVRSEGFMVGEKDGGFFRLQPCGPNNSQRKLIWVLPFQKEGYTRQAKILNQQ